MKNKITAIVIPILFFSGVGSGLCIDGEDIIKLKKSGINDRTIEVLLTEKAIQTCVFTVCEIIQ